MKINKNLLFFFFLPTFLILYVASNTQNRALGMVGIVLIVLNAIAALVTKK